MKWPDLEGEGVPRTLRKVLVPSPMRARELMKGKGIQPGRRCRLRAQGVLFRAF